MRQWLTVIAVLIGVASSGARAQSGPSLVPDPGRNSRGTQAFTLASSILGQTRRINVGLPPSFARTGPTRKYPVILTLDGEATTQPVVTVRDELTANEMIPESIVVGIENVVRIYDLTPPGLSVSGSDLNQGGDKFLDFIERELLPAIDRQFRGGLPRTLIGHSSGGILATYAAATRRTFRSVISIDAPIQLQRSWLATKLLGRTKDSSAGPLSYVAYESKFSWPNDAWAAIVAATPKSWLLRREPLRLEGHETVVFLASYLGLREIFADYSRLARPMASSKVMAHYTTVSASLGANVIPPRRVLREVIDDAVSEGRPTEARDAYTLLVTGYGEPADGGELLAEIADAERRPAPTETVDALLATPFPSPQEAGRFLGDWTGDVWFKSDAPRSGKTTLRIRVESGKVVAEMMNPNAPPEMQVRRVQYLRVTPGGLTFGFLNGMRPRAVMLHEGALIGDTLSGKSRFGGATVQYPPGDEPDPGFRFVRVKR